MKTTTNTEREQAHRIAQLERALRMLRMEALHFAAIGHGKAHLETEIARSGRVLNGESYGPSINRVQVPKENV